MLLRSRWTSVTVIMLLALAGCAGSGASAVPESSPRPTAEPNAAVTPSAAPMPTPTPDVAAMGKEYLAFASKFAKTQVAGNAAIDASTSDVELSNADQLLVDAASRAMDDLGSIELPADL